MEGLNFQAVTTDRFDNLLNKMNSVVTHWKPELNEVLVGTIKQWSSFEHSLYGVQDTVIVQTPIGEQVSVVLSAYLKKALKLQNATLGDAIAIRFNGVGSSKYGTSFNQYQVIVDKGAN